MKIIRKSIVRKSILLLVLLAASLFAAWNFLHDRSSFSNVPLSTVLYVCIGLLAVIFVFFLWGFVRPLRRVSFQINNLLTGKIYKRVDPTTIDEIGVVTHFFNEITRDLEKISYDVKERRRMSSELDIASSIQRDVLPKEAPEAVGLDIVAKTRSAAEVGGDTFDFLESIDGNQMFIYIGDVTGHGVPAGLVMMMVDTLVTAMVYQGVDNSQQLIVHTNNLLHPRISSRIFMTSVMLRWDKLKQKMYYTGAGHEHILVYRKQSEAVESITAGGIALGMIPDVSKIAQENEIPLEIGDCILLYTDGITEAKKPTGEMYGLDKLKESLKRNAYRPSAENVFDGLTKDFSGFVGEYVQIDDITMIVIKYVGKDVVTSKVKLTVSKDQASAEPKKKGWDWA